MNKSKTNIENKIETVSAITGIIAFIILASDSENISMEAFIEIKLIALVIMGVAVGLYKIAQIIKKEKYEQNRHLHYRTRRYGKY